MRPEHSPSGDPCTQCGLAAFRHRSRKRNRIAYDAKRKHRSGKPRDPSAPIRIIALDGEGYNDRRGRHLYTFMSACDSEGQVQELYAPRGIRFLDFAEWLLELPQDALLVGFSLGYDRAKWLESLPDDVVFAVEHPETRQGKHGARRVLHGEWAVNLVATRFSIGKALGGTISKGWRGGKQRRISKFKTRVVWDLFRFFQTSFVKALTKWDIGTPDERDAIEKMKQRRGRFRGIDEKERAYCRSECVLLAKLTRALLDAHELEGIVLDKYYGPGSTAAVVLKRTGAEEQRADVPPDMATAVDSAYFGGRFECSHVGPVTCPLFGYDIASAYPFAQSRLPCMAHGHFEHVTSPSEVYEAVQGDAPACVSFCIEPHMTYSPAWGPLPHRLKDGNIVFPIASAGGWAWNVELRMAMLLHSGVLPLEAWVWRPECDHPPPFRAEIERLYARRKELGKGARGIVLKLALNSLYGKSAQRVGGGGRFRCLVRAGLITGATRAMLLGAVRMAKDPWNILELATDSVLSREPLALPLGAELGLWESKDWPAGAFLVRPGMRFSLEADELGKTAARGLGVRTMHANRRKVLAAWEKEPMGPLTVQQPPMFHGSKSSLWRVLGDENPDGSRSWEYRRSALYGKWSEPTPRVLSYAPGPKRSGIAPSSVIPRGIALVPWRLPAGLRSVPYCAPAPTEDDLLRMLDAEQPEAGYLEPL